MSKEARFLIKKTTYDLKLEDWIRNKKISRVEMLILFNLNYQYYREIYYKYDIFIGKETVLEMLETLNRKSRTFKKELKRFSELLSFKEAYSFL
jgi:hypothetical protein